jgi:hypothetical protein
MRSMRGALLGAGLWPVASNCPTTISSIHAKILRGLARAT